MKREPAPTFRDPAGSLRLQGAQAVRSIRPIARQQVADFLDSSLRDDLERRGWLIESEADETGAGLCLRHPRIEVPVYPWEWTASQWLAAAHLTLDLCERALEAGWLLKDATPLNVLFQGARPTFVDVVSFERRQPSQSVWIAYGQFIRTFVLPLLMLRLKQWPLSLSLFWRDGYEPVELLASLGWWQRWTPTAFWSITLPAMLERRARPGATPAPPRKLNPEIGAEVLKRTFAGLRKRIGRLTPRSGESAWSEYTTAATHYSSGEVLEKKVWVEQVLDEVLAQVRPGRVLDIGANTGEYSALAAARGAQVVALERDAAAADRLFCRSRAQKLSILTVQADLARPTPAVGWNNTEYPSLLDRLEAQFDLVLLLAVIHHLLLKDQIPLPQIADLCLQLTRRHLIIEWVPAEDPMYRDFVRGREDLYGALHETDLLEAFGPRVNVRRRHVLSNGRVLLHLERSSG